MWPQTSKRKPPVAKYTEINRWYGALASQPGWKEAAEEAVFGAMRSFHFQIMGANRSHWDFHRGYELSITVAFGVLAVLIWQLSNLSRTEPRQAMPLIITILVAEILLSTIGWAYFFAGPGGMSILIAVCLAAAVFALRKSDQPALATGRAATAG